MRYGHRREAGTIDTRDCRNTRRSESQCLHKGNDLLNGELRTLPTGCKSLSGCSGSNLQTSSSTGRGSWFLIATLLLFFLSCCSATVIALDPTDPQVVHLLDLCRADQACALRWYLTSPPTPTTPWEAASFAYLLSRFAIEVLLSADGSLSTLPKYQDQTYLSTQAGLDPQLLTDVEALQDALYLSVLRSATFCGGLPNRMFRLGEGCICMPESDCSDAVASINAFETVTISIGVLFCAVVIVFGIWVVIDQLGRTQRAANSTEELLLSVKDAATGHAVVGQLKLRMPDQ